jgi:hypothetical protein
MNCRAVVFVGALVVGCGGQTSGGGGAGSSGDGETGVTGVVSGASSGTATRICGNGNGCTSGASGSVSGIGSACVTDSDCSAPGALTCAFAIAAGCSAKGTCQAVEMGGLCADSPACTCAGTTDPAPTCGFGGNNMAHEPIAYEGPCTDGGPIASDASADSGAAACVAAGGQCIAGVAFCANVGPGATPASCLDVSPDMLCCAVNEDAGCTEIQASSYDQSCNSDSDCVAVSVGNTCAECVFACGENVGAINAAAIGQYSADVAKTPAGIALCGCASEPMHAACCRGGQCHADNACSSLDGSLDGDAAGTPPKCASNSIAFDLTVDAPGPVYYGGPQGQGWLDSFGCPSWLAIAPADEPALNLVKGGCAISCPAFAPEPAMAQSFTWDGTYYPNVAVPCTGIACACQTPVCAPPGNYVATICVGYGDADAGPPETAPPTCKQVPFAWPPTSADQSIVESITPTPDGG